jgi:gamma-glutamylcyclotransferase (GGCT)/AIG2-like uncharacterized protein YtfP
MSSDRVRFLFAYGSLMSSAITAVGFAERAVLAHRARRVCEGSIIGRLYDVGPYPGAVLDGFRSERIFGEIWQLPQVRNDLVELLDRYEGCAPNNAVPHAYSRRKVVVRTAAGDRRVAWMYVWNGNVDPVARIRDGRWHGPGRTSPVTMSLNQTVNKAA